MRAVCAKRRLLLARRDIWLHRKIGRNRGMADIAGPAACSTRLRLTSNRHDDREPTIKPFHPAPERMRSPMILALVRKTMSQKFVVTPKLQLSKR
jgi:hypothetical protein